MKRRGNIGKNVETVRGLHGESRRDLARALLTDYDGIYRLEMGHKDIDEDLVEAISRYYMISKEELMQEDIDFCVIPSAEMLFRHGDVELAKHNLESAVRACDEHPGIAPYERKKA